MKSSSLFFLGLSLLAGCAGSPDEPVTVRVPGMANPEEQLDRALDQTRNFLVDFNGRLPTPARNTVALQLAAPLSLHAVTSQPQATPATRWSEDLIPASPAQIATTHFATPIPGKGGVTWFAYADGTPRLGCAPETVCLIWLERGEKGTADDIVLSPDSGWQAHLIAGAHGVHAAPAVALSARGNARKAALRISTDRRTYIWLLDPQASSMPRVHFVYSRNDPGTQPEIAQATIGPALQQAGAADFGFTIEGPDVPWKPIRVYSEHGKTWIEFPPHGVVSNPDLSVIAPQRTTPRLQHFVADTLVVEDVLTDFMLSAGSGSARKTLHIRHDGKH
ncbi:MULTISPECIES: TrbG/VirB9 family P-type conjugative transfer protein [Asaia]|uniref:Probable conjugal transfer protein TrbG n=1 Tax=Asaia bogorensis TaxID=91915 RepID=A0A060QJV8_9PROT|nr:MULTISPECIES: TrbG/VirB9 family P-type conjugative transfer protein [Asaia]CDG41013.1 probable conjugal transfer protein TrbG [Asaia bogorensis]